MTLILYVVVLGPLLSDVQDQREQEELWMAKLNACFAVSKTLKDYRESHGYSISLQYQFQQASVCAFALIDELTNKTVESSANAQLTGNRLPAFEECFRCIIGCGVQATLPRGVARMLCLKARRANVPWSQAMEEIIRIVEKTAWEPSDIDKFNSTYPSYRVSPNHGSDVTDLQQELRALQVSDTTV